MTHLQREKEGNYVGTDLGELRLTNAAVVMRVLGCEVECYQWECSTFNIIVARTPYLVARRLGITDKGIGRRDTNVCYRGDAYQ